MKHILGSPSLVSQKVLLAISKNPSIPAFKAKHCCVRATKGTRAWSTSSSITSPILIQREDKESSYFQTLNFRTLKEGNGKDFQKRSS